MSEAFEIVLPFKGERNYIAGVDFVSKALDLLSDAGGPIHDVTLACYQMLKQCRLSVTVGQVPLGPKDCAAVVRASAGEVVYFVGFSPAADDGTIVREPCLEAEQLRSVRTDRCTAEIARPQQGEAALLPMLVAAIKSSSARSFPARTGKWIFAQCRLQALPDDWKTASVQTQATEQSRFFDWSVYVDGQDLGKIVFFVHEAETAS